MLDIAQQSFVPRGLASNGYSAHDSSRQCPPTEPSSLSHRFRLTLLNGSLINGVTTWGTRLVFFSTARAHATVEILFDQPDTNAFDSSTLIHKKNSQHLEAITSRARFLNMTV